MSRWTRWRLLTTRHLQRWNDSTFDHHGPACYELGVGTRVTAVEIVYIGETSDEARRMKEYASGRAHLWMKISAHLWGSTKLYYRSQAKATKAEAKAMQDRLLARWGGEYRLNTRRSAPPPARPRLQQEIERDTEAELSP